LMILDYVKMVKMTLESLSVRDGGGLSMVSWYFQDLRFHSSAIGTIRACSTADPKAFHGPKAR